MKLLGVIPPLPKLLLLFEPETPSSAVQKEPQILTMETEKLLELYYWFWETSSYLFHLYTLRQTEMEAWVGGIA